jgi:hypothetical protein
MDIQIIVIVGDRTVSDDGDVEWSNVHKDQLLYTSTKPNHTLVSGRFKSDTSLNLANYVRKISYILMHKYLNQHTISSDRC